MFLRKAGRSLKRPSAQLCSQAADAIQLPFLCPALYGVAQIRNTTNQVKGGVHPAKQGHAAVIHNAQDLTPPRNRGLASAATAADLSFFQGDYVPWGEPPRSPHDNSHFDPTLLPSMQDIDLSRSPLVINGTPITGPRRFRNTDGEIGDPNELHQTLHACIQVGRIQRAAALVRRLAAMYKPDAPGLLAAHKDYMTELSLRAVRKKDPVTLQELMTWFEVEVQRNGVPVDGPLLALMIQACLGVPATQRSARALRRYNRIAQELGFEAEVHEILPQLEGALKDDIDTPPSFSENEVDVLERKAKSGLPSPPELREVELQGMGLKSLKKSLSSLADVEGVQNAQTNIERQMALEKDTTDAALDRWKTDNEKLLRLGIYSGFKNSALEKLMSQWHTELVPLIKDEIQKVVAAETAEHRSSEDRERLRWGPFLQSLPPETVSMITIKTVLLQLAIRTDKKVGVVLTVLLGRIMVRLEEEYYFASRQKHKNGKELRRLVSRRLQGQKGAPKSAYARLTMDDEANMRENFRWPQVAGFKLSAMLLSKLMKVALAEVSYTDANGVEQMQMRPVFFHTFAFLAGTRKGVLRTSDKMQQMLSTTPLAVAIAKFLPMVCEPKPWTDFRDGGFLRHRSTVIRYPAHDSFTYAYGKTASQNGDLLPLFTGLNNLGKTPWNINRAVLEVMSQLWNTGEAITNIPPEKPSKDYPPEPLDDPRARRAWLSKLRDIDNHVAGLKTERAFMNFQLEIARTYADETFYFPHSVDFRGRAYPIPPIFNHMGSDHCRGLLLFSKGKELGMSGLRWLKIHLANVFGYDKASFTERLEFTENHLDDITDSATNSLQGRRWWLDAEDPWQCLATCIELHNALQQPDPTRYISRLPIQQDGTCNGLQHYAALGGDEIGAQQVNLEPGDRPSDLYTAVAGMVQSIIHQDALDKKSWALQLDGKITRKVVKQTVMTNVYGVTLIGATDQVRKQLEDVFPLGPTGRSVDVKGLSRYVAKTIFQALANSFSGAQEIQRWFLNCGNRICSSVSAEQMDEFERVASAGPKDTQYKAGYTKETISEKLALITPIIWTTPLGLPVVQPYRKERTIELDTEIQEIALRTLAGASVVDKRKQLAGFPPNFIHSLDGTHMFLTANQCSKLGLTFAMVHDSFWTHASDVDILNRVNRDAFIRMHSEDIVGRLAAEFSTRYKGYMRKVTIPASHEVLKAMRQWRRRHVSESRHVVKNLCRDPEVSELLLERQRVRLLSSSDPQQRKEGEAMVTPASIAATYPLEEIAPPASLGGIPKRRQKVDVPAATEQDEDEEAAAEKKKFGEEAREDYEPTIRKKRIDSADSKAYPRDGWYWKPLEFPAVPEKGKFDISRLRNSSYFFS